MKRKIKGTFFTVIGVAVISGMMTNYPKTGLWKIIILVFSAFLILLGLYNLENKNPSLKRMLKDLIK